MPGHPRPERLASLSSAAGELARGAGAAAEELLDSLVMVGDHATQRSVDDAVDALVARLRTVSAEAGELAWVLGSQAGPATRRQETTGTSLPVEADR